MDSLTIPKGFPCLYSLCRNGRKVCNGQLAWCEFTAGGDHAREVPMAQWTLQLVVETIVVEQEKHWCKDSSVKRLWGRARVSREGAHAWICAEERKKRSFKLL